jgi:hypothetical protein
MVAGALLEGAFALGMAVASSACLTRLFEFEPVDSSVAYPLVIVLLIIEFGWGRYDYFCSCKLK